MRGRLRKFVLLFCLLKLFDVSAAAQDSTKPTWTSAAIGTAVHYEIFTPKTEIGASKLPVAVVLKNLPNQTGDEKQQIAELIGEGYVVMSVDYANNAKAVAPNINADLLKLRRDIPSLLEKYKVDEDRIFPLPVGYKIAQDVEYYRQDGRSYRLDIRYPANAKTPVPLIMQISHDNVDRRRNHGYVRFNDSLLEGLMLRGYAVAMIEHLGVGTPGGKTPVMPDYIYKLKSVVRTLRANAKRFNFYADRIAAIGFSKGATAAAMLATMNERELEGDGFHKEFSSRISAAVYLAGRFDYRDLDEMYTEREEWERFLRVHGHPAENKERYSALSPITYITPDDAPMFFFVGEADSTRPPNTRRMVAALRRAGHAPEHLEEEDLQHRVTTDTKAIEAIYRFLDKHLKGINNATK